MGRVPLALKRSHLNAGKYRRPEAEDSAFSWRDVPRAIWAFLDKNKSWFVFANVILFTVFFYELVPPFIMGKVVDFFTGYRAGDSAARAGPPRKEWRSHLRK